MSGGSVRPCQSDGGNDSVPALLSPGRFITDPDEAEALGMTVEARRLRERQKPPTIRMVGGRRMQCKDIPDEVFLDAVRRAGEPGRWRMRWNVQALLEREIGLVPENLLLAKARKLIARRLMGGCACGCRGDWHPTDECEVGACCRPREDQR